MNNIVHIEPHAAYSNCVTKASRAEISGKVTLHASCKPMRHVEVRAEWLSDFMTGLTATLMWVVSAPTAAGISVGGARGITLRQHAPSTIGIWSTKSLDADSSVKPLVVVGQDQVQALIDAVALLRSGKVCITQAGVYTCEELQYTAGSVATYPLRYMLSVTMVEGVGLLMRIVQFYGDKFQNRSVGYIPVSAFIDVMAECRSVVRSKSGGVYVGDIAVNTVPNSKSAGQLQIDYHKNAGLVARLPSDNTGNVRVFVRVIPDFEAFYKRLFNSSTQ